MPLHAKIITEPCITNTVLSAGPWNAQG